MNLKLIKSISILYKIFFIFLSLLNVLQKKVKSSFYYNNDFNFESFYFKKNDSKF